MVAALEGRSGSGRPKTVKAKTTALGLPVVGGIEAEIEQGPGLWVFNCYLFESQYGRPAIDFRDLFDGLDSLTIITKLRGPTII
jgi:hypothetical protein